MLAFLFLRETELVAMEWDVVAVLSSPTIMITQKHPFVNREIKKFIIIFL